MLRWNDTDLSLCYVPPPVSSGGNMNDVGLTLQTMENVTLCAQGVHRTACVLCLHIV